MRDSWVRVAQARFRLMRGSRSWVVTERLPRLSRTWSTASAFAAHRYREAFSKLSKEAHGKWRQSTGIGTDRRGIRSGAVFENVLFNILAACDRQ
jgi:hypothetical protein